MKRPFVCYVAVEPELGSQVRADLTPSPWRLKHYTLANADGCKTDAIDFTLLVTPDVDARALSLIVNLSGPDAPPLLVITPDEEPRSIADALSSGATDVTRYPFARAELAARVESILRRRQWNDADPTSPLLVLDGAHHSLVIGDRQVTFPPREWMIFKTLIEYGGTPVTAARLSQVDQGRALSHATVVATISRLRGRLRRLDVSGIRVHTIPGRGYQLDLSLPMFALPRDADVDDPLNTTLPHDNENGGTVLPY